MFLNCPLESLISVSGTAVRWLRRESQAGLGFPVLSDLDQPLLLCVLNIEIPCKISFGGRTMKCSAIKKDLKTTFLDGSACS